MKRVPYLLIALFFLMFSCQSVSNDIDEPENNGKTHVPKFTKKEMKEELSLQKAVLSMSWTIQMFNGFIWDGKYFDLFFGNGENVTLNSSMTPLVQIRESGQCCLNGVLSKSKYDYCGSYPIVDFNDEGELMFDGTVLEKGLAIDIDEKWQSLSLINAVLVTPDTLIVFPSVEKEIREFRYSDKSIITFNECTEILRDIAGAGKTVLCHFSDIHGSGNDLLRITQFCSYHGISKVICSGDTCFSIFTDNNIWNNSPAYGYLFNTVGNHDCWQGKSFAQTDKPYDAPVADVYRNIMVGERELPFVKAWGAVQPDGVATNTSPHFSSCYYYLDLDSSIRLIVLDCLHFDELQREWLDNVLELTRQQKKAVVISSHYPLKDNKTINCPYTFKGYIDAGYVESDHKNCYTDSEAAECVDRFMERNGEFVCWLSGHMHMDALYYLPDHHNQLVVQVESATIAQGSDPNRKHGEKSQDSFNILVIDPGKQGLSILRVGNTVNSLGKDKTLTEINYRSLSMR